MAVKTSSTESTCVCLIRCVCVFVLPYLTPGYGAKSLIIHHAVICCKPVNSVSREEPVNSSLPPLLISLTHPLCLSPFVSARPPSLSPFPPSCLSYQSSVSVFHFPPCVADLFTPSFPALTSLPVYFHHPPSLSCTVVQSERYGRRGEITQTGDVGQCNTLDTADNSRRMRWKETFLSSHFSFETRLYIHLYDDFQIYHNY